VKTNGEAAREKDDERSCPDHAEQEADNRQPLATFAAARQRDQAQEKRNRARQKEKQWPEQAGDKRRHGQVRGAWRKPLLRQFRVQVFLAVGTLAGLAVHRLHAERAPGLVTFAFFESCHMTPDLVASGGMEVTARDSIKWKSLPQGERWRVSRACRKTTHGPFSAGRGGIA